MKSIIVSDKQKLISILSVLLSAGFIITSLASYFVSRDAIRDSILKHELPLTSDNIYSEIQKDLVSPTFISSMMASDTFLRDWVLDGEKNVAQISRYLQEIKKRYGTFASFFISERSSNYYHEKGILKQVSMSDAHDVWYYRVSAMQQAYEISVDTDQANRNALTIFINYRVFDYDGNFIGVAGIGLTVDAVRQLVDNYQKRYKRNIFFTDSKGDIVLTSSNGDTPEANIRKISGLSPQVDKILNRQLDSFQYEQDGMTHLVNVRFIPELDWYLFVEKHEEEAIAEIRNTLYLNLAVCLLITGIVLAATNLTINRYQRRLEEMATTDKLTGLANRRSCEFVASHAVKVSERTHDPLSIVIIDIDNFKSINDQYGHLAGDEIIKSVAETLKSCVRDSDFICRWGGEEYLLLLRNCNITDAQQIAEKMRSTIKETTYAHHGAAINVTLSLGIATHVMNESVNTLFSRADMALYEAKQRGRDRICIA